MISQLNMIAALVLTFVVALTEARKDAGMVPHPAEVSFQKCKMKGTSLSGCQTKTNNMIQQGECWANPRVLRQKSAFFVPTPSNKYYSAEGGPYGDCIAFDCWPQVSDLEEAPDYTYWCFFWDGTLNCEGGCGTGGGGGAGKKKKKSGKGDGEGGNSTDTSGGGGGGGSMPSTAPGEKGTPMPIVCPSTLNDCYSADWFDPGGKLEKYGSLKPTYKGIWFPLKDKSTHEPLFCQGLNLGCETVTMRELQLHTLPKAGCNVASCKGGSGGGGGGGGGEGGGCPSSSSKKKKSSPGGSPPCSKSPSSPSGTPGGKSPSEKSPKSPKSPKNPPSKSPPAEERRRK